MRRLLALAISFALAAIVVGLLLMFPVNLPPKELPCENGIVLGYIATSQASVFDTEDGYQGTFGPYEKTYIVVKGESGKERMYEVKWKGMRTAPSEIVTAWLCVDETTNPMKKYY